jgi:hypothetical protein
LKNNPGFFLGQDDGVFESFMKKLNGSGCLTNGYGKQVLFTATKNGAKKAKKNGINFHIIKGGHPSFNNLNVDASNLHNYIIPSDENLVLPMNWAQHNDAKIKECKNTVFQNKLIQKPNKPYWEYLITAAEAIIEKGITSFEEIHTPFTGSKKNQTIKNSQRINELNIDSSSSDEEGHLHSSLRKCDNKVCAVLAPKNANIWIKIKNNKSKNWWLCQSCHKAWKIKHYCYYCSVIYKDASGSNGYSDSKSWIQCDYCELWQHMQCEESKGCFRDLSELNTDPSFKYMCPFCRKKKETSSQNSSVRSKKSNGKEQLLGNKVRNNENIITDENLLGICLF